MFGLKLKLIQRLCGIEILPCINASIILMKIWFCKRLNKLFESKLMQSDSVSMHGLINLLEYRYEDVPASITADLGERKYPETLVSFVKHPLLVCGF